MRFLLAAILLVCCGSAPAVEAQSRQVLLDASARAFFRQGLKLADEKQYSAAADRFRRALSIHDSPVIAYNLASVLEMSGEVVESLELLFQVETAREAPEELRETARRLRLSVEPKLAFLTIELQRAAPVFLDDVALTAAQISVPIPVDPGPHRLRWAAPTRRFLERRIDLDSGQELRVVLGRSQSSMEPTRVSAASLKGVRRQPSAHTAGGRLLRDPWFWGGVGAAVVTVVATVAVVTLAGSSK